MARRLTFAAAAGICGLGLMAFTLPVPLPSVTPTAPVPLPSVPALVGGSSGNPGQQQAGAPPASKPAAAPPVQHAPAAVVASAPATTLPADGPLQTQVKATALAAGLPPSTGAHPAAAAVPRTPGGGAPPPLSLLLAAFGAAFALVATRLVRLHRRRDSRVRISVRSLAGDGSLDAALDAAFCLCQSMLPDGASARRLGDSMLAVLLGAADPDELETALGRISQRARRVGLDLEWSEAGRPQFAERLVPA